MVAVLVVTVAPQARASGRTCPVDDVDPAVRFTSRCINGVDVASREGITALCFQAVSWPRVEIERGACADKKLRQSEKIAQARFIQYLNGFADTAISSGIQWEVRTIRIGATGESMARIDVLQYAPGAGDPAANPVAIWEVKGNWNGGAPAAVPQVNGYIAAVQQQFGWEAAHLGAAGFSDYFEVKDYYRCKDGNKVNGRYSVTTPVSGVVLVTELAPNACRDKNDEETEEEAEAVGEQANEDDASSGTSNSQIDDLSDELTGLGISVVTAAGVGYALWMNSAWICLRVTEMTSLINRTGSSISDPGKACYTAEMAKDAAVNALPATATAAQYELAASNAMRLIAIQGVGGV